MLRQCLHVLVCVSALHGDSNCIVVWVVLTQLEQCWLWVFVCAFDWSNGLCISIGPAVWRAFCMSACISQKQTPWHAFHMKQRGCACSRGGQQRLLSLTRRCAAAFSNNAALALVPSSFTASAGVQACNGRTAAYTQSTCFTYIRYRQVMVLEFFCKAAHMHT
jgi:hypothetical protein